MTSKTPAKPLSVDLADVTAAASKLVNHMPLSASVTGAGKIYEAWVMMEIGLVLQASQWSVNWVVPSPSATSQIVFRGNPGFLAPSGKSAVPGYLSIFHSSSKEAAFEIHNSVKYTGRSGCFHEIDISILGKAAADQARANKGSPRGLPLVMLELKHYQKGFHIGIVRAMLLIGFDLLLVSKNWASAIFSPRSWKMLAGRRKPFPKTYVAAVTSAADVGSSNTLAKFYGAHVQERFVPDPSQKSGNHPAIQKCVKAMLPFIR